MSKREFNTEYPIPEGLSSTYIMLGKAFPNGIPCEQYWIVLKLLYNGMSDRQLAEAIAHFTQKDMLSIYCEDIPKVYHMEFTESPLFVNTKRLLIACGYLQWLDED